MDDESPDDGFDIARAVRLAILEKSRRGIGPEDWDRGVLANLPVLQKEFQQTYCASCRHYDLESGTYRERGHPNDAADCKFHWTDVLGECWNFRWRTAQDIPREPEPKDDPTFMRVLRQALGIDPGD